MCAALVTGGSQGVGKGVVEGLCEAGHQVYFMGRSEELLKRTADEASALGGDAFPRRVDHDDDEQVKALFSEIGDRHQLDVLVNSAWGGYENMIEDGRYTWADPYWAQPMWRWSAMMDVGVRSAFVASQHATRLMRVASLGLIVNISFWAAQKHIGNTLYGMAKAATDKMTSDMAEEIDTSNINIISMYPGLVRTKKVMAFAEHLDLSNSESPRFIGRTSAALWLDQSMMAKLNGQGCVAAEIARDLGVVDVDGESPKPLTSDSA